LRGMLLKDAAKRLGSWSLQEEDDNVKVVFWRDLDFHGVLAEAKSLVIMVVVVVVVD
jgi:hypothetical protein